ncbi:MAG: LON peptidase substrate-binding domain-containing protein [Alphaproteobacteria bacterium]
MARGKVRTDWGALPDIVPLFPLPGVLLLPRGRLPLNVFEPRYLAMTEHALGSGRLIGMIQPADPEASLAINPGGPQAKVYDVGCAGRITQFSETDDGRYLVTLTGVSRFRVAAELALAQAGYRSARVAWDAFAADRAEPETAPIDREALLAALKAYFERRKLAANWDSVVKASDEALITALAMACPFDPSEKQALLESPDLARRAKLLLTLFRIGAAGAGDGDVKVQ